MEKEFVPYELGLRMKQLGFNEVCFSYFLNGILQPTLNPKDYSAFEEVTGIRLKYFEYVLAPTWQSAFKWFREKYELHSCIHSDYTWNISGGIWDLNEYKGSRYDWDYSNNYSTYEEAELSCLTKLIEIVESKTE